jgi:PII-like signaling protein
MSTPQEGLLLRIFLGESDKHGLVPLYEWIVRKAKEHGLAGATVLRGLGGFGTHRILHTAKMFRLSTDQPVVVEIVDTTEKIEAFIPVLDEAIPEGLATFQRVQVRFYRRGKKSPSERLR